LGAPGFSATIAYYRARGWDSSHGEAVLSALLVGGLFLVLLCIAYVFGPLTLSQRFPRAGRVVAFVRRIPGLSRTDEQ
jgi:hypothetical protein